MRVAANPRLYDPTADDPVLNGTECRHCTRVQFPPLGLGCETCGATEAELSPKQLGTDGVVFAVAEVHLSPDHTPTPFTVVEVVLDDGPLIRAMAHPESADIQIGDRVRGRWRVIEHDAAGADVVEPAFEASRATTGVSA